MSVVKKGFVRLLLSWLGIGLLFSVSAEQVILNPAFISGKITLGNEVINLATVTADSATSGSSSTTSNDGVYTLTVNAPANGSTQYTVNANVSTQNSRNFMRFLPQTVVVTDGQTSALDFSVEPGYLSGQVVLTGALLAGGSIRASLNANGAFSDASGLLDENGFFRFPVQPNVDIDVSGSVSTGDGRSFNLDPVKVTVAAGETVQLPWSLDVPPPDPTGAVFGTIQLTGFDNSDRHVVSIAGPAFASQQLAADGGFRFDKLKAGGYALSVQSLLNQGDDSLNHPIANRRFTIVAGGEVQMDYSGQAAFINGVISLSGSKTWRDVTGALINYNGVAGGTSQDKINIATGAYDVVATTGTWRLGNITLQFADNDPLNFLNSSMIINDRRFAEDIILGAADTVVRHLDYKTGTVTVNFTVKGGGVLSSPTLSAVCVEKDVNANTLYAISGSARGSGEVQAEGRVMFVGIASDCDFSAFATVGGSSVSFGNVPVRMEPGTDIVVDIGGPDLNVTSPAAELITTDGQVAVSGTVTDDTAVASVTINGAAVALQSSNNSTDPNEMRFSTVVTLQPGPNTITTVALDTEGQSASDKRTVYLDQGPPRISWTPADGSVTADQEVVISGIADDDHLVKKVTVNGIELAVTAAAQVPFSTVVALNEGDNALVVTATDASNRTTSQTHIISRANAGNRPPLADAGADQNKECAGPLTPVTLDGSASSDPDGDPLTFQWSGSGGTLAGVVVNPLLPLGAYTFTLQVDDGRGGMSSDTVRVNIADTLAPDIQLQSPLILEAQSAAGTVYEPVLRVIDSCDPNPAVTVTPLGNVFPIGATTFTVQAVDVSDHNASRVFTVQVRDTTAPLVTAPADIELPAADTLTVVDLGTASAVDAVGVVAVTHDAPAAFPVGVHTVTWTALDAAGNAGTATQKITIINRLPVVEPQAMYTVDEGSPFILELPITDPGSAAWSAQVDFGDGGGPQPAAVTGNRVRLDHVYADNGDYLLSLSVTDNHGGTGTAQFLVRVNNVAPVITALQTNTDVLAVAASLTLDGSFTDAGVLDSHQIRVQWGDGLGDDVPVNESGGSGSFTTHHVYAAAGTYTVTVTVVDKDGGEAIRTISNLVVFDPSAGSVTGGGHVQCHAGAYPPAASLAGKVNFGFVVKYQPGASRPTGNLTVHFNSAKVKFKASGFQSLMVQPGKAVFSGSGTINGSGDYRFTVTAMDASPDTWHIRIWDPRSGAVVFDNHGCDRISGSIVIHRPTDRISQASCRRNEHEHHDRHHKKAHSNHAGRHHGNRRHPSDNHDSDHHHSRQYHNDCNGHEKRHHDRHAEHRRGHERHQARKLKRLYHKVKSRCAKWLRKARLWK